MISSYAFLQRGEENHLILGRRHIFFFHFNNATFINFLPFLMKIGILRTKKTVSSSQIVNIVVLFIKRASNIIFSICFREWGRLLQKLKNISLKGN